MVCEKHPGCTFEWPYNVEMENIFCKLSRFYGKVMTMFITKPEEMMP
jgi:hypothetical protein